MLLAVAMLFPQLLAAQQTVPYTENFDSYGLGSNTFMNISTTVGSIPGNYPNHTLPTGWNFIGSSASASSTPNPYLLISSTWGSGTCLAFKSNSSNAIYAVLPEMATALNQLKITFSYRNNDSYSGTQFVVGYMTSPTNSSTFVALETVPRSSSKTTFTHDFSADNLSLSAQSHYYIAIKLNAGASSKDATIDDVTVALGASAGGSSGGGSGSGSGSVAGTEVTVGNNTLTTSDHPIYSHYTSATMNYPYAISWAIYTATELGMSTTAGNINAIAYQYASSTAISAPIKIYMTTANLSALGRQDTTARSSMTLVYSGTASFSNASTWSTIVLQTPYRYDPTQGNLIVMVERNGSTGATGNFYYTNATNKVWYNSCYSTTSGWSVPNYNDNKRANTRFTIGPAQSLTQYTISTSVNDASMGSVSGGGIYNSGATANLTATANSGYHFVQWSDGSTVNPRSITVTGNATYTANFAVDVTTNYTITALSADNTTGTVTGSGTYAENATAQLTATAASGYHFVQWNDGNTDNPRNVTVTGNATYVATFAANVTNYTITAVSSNDATGTVSGGGSYAENSIAQLTATPATGYHFVQWNDGNTDNPRSIVVTANASYVATFAADNTPSTNSYTITAVANDNTMGTVMGSGTYNENATAQIAAVANSGYRFDRWNDGNTSNPRTITVTGNATYVATFVSIDAPQTQTYTITVVSADNNKGTVSGSGSYAENTSVTITATALSGYTFAQWNDGSTDASRTIVVTANATYTATFVANGTQLPTSYTLTVASADNNMGTAVGGGNYVENATATLSAIAATGYHFTMWSDGETSNPRTVSVTANATYTAQFAADGTGDPADPTTPFSISAVANNDSYGTVTGSGRYAANAAATLEATPAAGYHFFNWNDGTAANPRSITVTGDATYVANFVADGQNTNYDVEGLANNSTMGSVIGGGHFPQGTIASLTARANDGYHFVCWSNGSTDATISFTVNSNISLIALFEANDPSDPTGANTTYTVTAGVNNASYGSATGSGTYHYGDVATLSATPNASYRFVNWSDGSTDNPRTITVTGNITLMANFASTTNNTMYTVSVSANEAGRGSVSGAGTYPPYAYVAVRAVAADGFVFEGWDNGEVDNPLFIILVHDTSLVANFGNSAAPTVRDTFNITVRANDASLGVVSGSGRYEEYSLITIAATANPGAHFVRWNDGVTEPLRNITVTADATYVAFFEANVGIADIEAANAEVFAYGQTIVVKGAEHSEVNIFDISGRHIAKGGQQAECRFTISQPGIYMVKVASAPARRVVIVK